MVQRILLVVLTLAACGCFMEIDTWSDRDADGVADEADCAPDDPTTHSLAADPHGDGEDTNCDGVDGTDFDGDGYPGNADGEDTSDVLDCDDGDDTVHPGAEDVEGDGIDSDCDGHDQ